MWRRYEKVSDCMKVVGICVDLSRLATAVNGDGLGFASEVLSSVPAERCHVTSLALPPPEHRTRKAYWILSR